MELRLQSTVQLVATTHSKNKAAKASDHRNFNAIHRSGNSPLSLKLNKQPSRKTCKISCAVPETATSVVVAATIVVVAATLLARRSEASVKTEAPAKICEECGGSGICPDCKGEGFVLKKLSDESSERARTMAESMATRYTAGLPKKWSYCTRCSSTRSCCSCGGTGKLS